MADGKLIRRVKSARPWLPTIVLLDECDYRREAAARSLGVTAVLAGEPEACLLSQVVQETLGLETPMKAETEPVSLVHTASRYV